MRKSRTFYNIFIPFLLLGLGLVIGFGSYIYSLTIQSVVEGVEESQESLVTQIKNTLEQKIQTIEYAFNTYSTTKSFNTVINSPLTEQDFQTYRELNSQLSYIATMGLNGVQYSLISLEQNWSISGGSVSRLSNEERKEIYETYVEPGNQSLFWKKTDSGIRFVQTLPVYSKKKKALALSDISLATLNNSLQTNAGTPLYIINKQGDLLYSAKTEDQELAGPQLSQIVEQASDKMPSGRIKIKGGNEGTITAIYSKSSYNNWLYVTVLDKTKVSEALAATRVGLIVMGFVIMLLIVVVAYYLSIYLTRPFRKIQSSLSKNAEPVEQDEVDWIIRSIGTIVSEKESLEHLIELEKPKLEMQFVLNLLHNRLNEEEVDRSVQRFGYPIYENTAFVTMLIQLDSYGDRRPSDKDVLLLALNNRVRDTVPETERLLPVVLNDQSQATVLFFRNSGDPQIKKQVMQYAKTIIKTTRESLGFHVSIGISKVYGRLMESKEACDMSLEALHQRLNLGKESIIFYDDISSMSTGPIPLQYPNELEVHLFEAIRLGDEKEVSRYLYPLLAEMMKHGKNPMHLEVTLVRFVNNLIQLEQSIGAQVLMTQSNANLYHRLLDTRNPEEIERILVQELIQPMVDSMKAKSSRQISSIADQIAVIVRTEYDQNISLESIGARLHYSPNYLGSIFKKEYDMTFSDYLMNYRLEMAKKWLIDTELSVKDISERLRYQNPQNFIRNFRKREQVTPGEYRKIKLGG